MSWLSTQFVLWLATCIDLKVCSREWSGDVARAPRRPRYRRGDIDVKRSIFADKNFKEARIAMSKYMTGQMLVKQYLCTRLAFHDVRCLALAADASRVGQRDVLVITCLDTIARKCAWAPPQVPSVCLNRTLPILVKASRAGWADGRVDGRTGGVRESSFT